MAKQKSGLKEEKKSKIKLSSETKYETNNVFYVLIFILPLLTAYYYYNFAYSVNQFLSFPLDDSWIHLTFAKNIKEYFSFSYYRDEMVTSGSTSPLFTVLLAIGFFIINNEMILSYTAGVLFFAASSVILYKLSLSEFEPEKLIAFLCTCIFILDKWMNFISLSGMETTSFIFLLLLGAYSYKKRKAVLLGLTCGLIIWTRPDGIAFIPAAALDYLLLKYFFKNEKDVKFFSGRELTKILLIFSIVTAAYLLTNLYLSGSVLPNTYSAKIAYFIGIESRLNFLTLVWNYFTEGYYVLIMAGFIISFMMLLHDIYKRNYNKNLFYISFILMFLFMYWMKMPAINRFGRYIMPLIPFFILVSISGYNNILKILIRTLKSSLLPNSIFYIFILVIFVYCFNDYAKYKETYSYQCRYIYERQVKAAQWINKNTNENDIIATHDIGAIGFYTGRKLVDAAGLVTPYLNSKLNEKNYTELLEDYMRSNGVKYIAFLQEWFSISNQKPLYSTPDAASKEIMEIYIFNPEKTHILSKDAHYLLKQGVEFIEKKDANKILSTMNQVIEMEPEDSYPYFFKAYAYTLMYDDINFENNIKKSISLYPDFIDAHLNYGNFLFSKGRFEEAGEHISKVLELEPSNQYSASVLEQIKDSIKAKESKSEKK